MVPFGIVRQGLKFRDQLENMLGTRTNVLINILRRIEHEILRQITDN